MLTSARAEYPRSLRLKNLITGGGFFGGEIGEECKQFCIKQEFTTADSPKENGVVERALGIIQNAARAACIQAPIIFPHVQLPPTKFLWAEAVYWYTDAMNHTVTTAKLGNKSPHEMWYGTAEHASPNPFLRPACSRLKRPSKPFPRVELCFSIAPGIDHPSDSSRMLTWAIKVVETRGVTWEATPHAEAPPPSLPKMPEQARTI